MCLSQCVIGYCSSLKSFHQREGDGGEGAARRFNVGGEMRFNTSYCIRTSPAHLNQTTSCNWHSKQFPIHFQELFDMP